MENLKYASHLIKEIISKNISCKVKLVVLDLGCSGGPDHIFVDLNNLEEFIEYYGYDFNDEEIKRLSTVYPSNFKFYSKKIVTERKIENDNCISHKEIIRYKNERFRSCTIECYSEK